MEPELTCVQFKAAGESFYKEMEHILHIGSLVPQQFIASPLLYSLSSLDIFMQNTASSYPNPDFLT